MSKGTAEDIEFSFISSKSSEEVRLLDVSKEEKSIIKLTTLVNSLKDKMTATGIPKWEISLEGYIEANTGILPGGKASFKATVTLSN